MGALTNL
jgi:calcium-dependent protein kinase